MSVDVEELKRLAEAVQGERRGSRAGVEAMARFISAANHATVLALLERGRRLEEALRRAAAREHAGHDVPLDSCPFSVCVGIRKALEP